MFKKIVFLGLIIAAAYLNQTGTLNLPGIDSLSPSASIQSSNNKTIVDAINNRSRYVQVQGYGTVKALLRDDNKGDRHQKFILSINDHQTVLVAHNIDMATKIKNLHKGDRVDFSGEYIWNQRGGVLHWTHHSNRGNHPAGWLKHNGKTYQ